MVVCPESRLSIILTPHTLRSEMGFNCVFFFLSNIEIIFSVVQRKISNIDGWRFNSTRIEVKFQRIVYDLNVLAYCLDNGEAIDY